MDSAIKFMLSSTVLFFAEPGKINWSKNGRLNKTFDFCN